MRSPIACLVATALAGCAPYARLEPRKVAALDLGLVGGGDTVCVNDPGARVVARAVYRNGALIESWTGHGSRHGRYRLHELAIAAGPVGVGEHGELRFPSPLTWLDRPIDILASVPARPIAASLSLAPRYDCGGLADFAAARGAGADSGDDGGEGADGPALQVAIAQVDTELNGRLLLVRVTGGGGTEYHLVDARGPAVPFAISAAGGAGGGGGAGSSGSSGSDGSDGRDGSAGGSCEDGSDGTSGSDGSDGSDGSNGGDGGRGGRGGTIAIEYAAGDEELVDELSYVVRGGPGGAAGAGGSGGSGGSGGDGGSGGAAGSSLDTNGKSCSTSAGSNGSDGTRGYDGSDGSDGSQGRPGPDGTITARQVDGAQLWRAEIAAGIKVVIGEAR